MAKQVGTVLKMLPAHESTDLSRRSGKQEILDLMDRSLSLSDAYRLRDLAKAEPVERETPATFDQLSKRFEFLAATLPTRGVDDETGRHRVAVYAQMLGGYSDDTLKFMVGEILRIYDWFPSPRQCIEAAERAPRDANLADRALMVARQSIQSHFEAWLKALFTRPVDQSVVDGAPDYWRRIAKERGVLCLTPDGDWVHRFR